VSDGAAAEPGRRGTGVAIACDGVARVWVGAPVADSSKIRPLKVETVVAVWVRGEEGVEALADVADAAVGAVVFAAAEAASLPVSGWRRGVSEPWALEVLEA
jgi:hypothetical protein